MKSLWGLKNLEENFFQVFEMFILTRFSEAFPKLYMLRIQALKKINYGRKRILVNDFLFNT